MTGFRTFEPSHSRPIRIRESRLTSVHAAVEAWAYARELRGRAFDAWQARAAELWDRYSDECPLHDFRFNWVPHQRFAIFGPEESSGRYTWRRLSWVERNSETGEVKLQYTHEDVERLAGIFGTGGLYVASWMQPLNDRLRSQYDRWWLAYLAVGVLGGEVQRLARPHLPEPDGWSFLNVSVGDHRLAFHYDGQGVREWTLLKPEAVSDLTIEPAWSCSAMPCDGE